MCDLAGRASLTLKPLPRCSRIQLRVKNWDHQAASPLLASKQQLSSGRSIDRLAASSSSEIHEREAGRRRCKQPRDSSIVKETNSIIHVNDSTSCSCFDHMLASPLSLPGLEWHHAPHTMRPRVPPSYIVNAQSVHVAMAREGARNRLGIYVELRDWREPLARFTVWGGTA
ncbi:hypothetical protein GE09DRAFT_268816 [Coniochaeta sp. 2T2.1]|nr:hypothetical protein GE09DRAFT_268816 [Coniochaeta sp. 2T2.1]